MITYLQTADPLPRAADRCPRFSIAYAGRTEPWGERSSYQRSGGRITWITTAPTDTHAPAPPISPIAALDRRGFFALVRIEAAGTGGSWNAIACCTGQHCDDREHVIPAHEWCAPPSRGRMSCRTCSRKMVGSKIAAALRRVVSA